MSAIAPRLTMIIRDIEIAVETANMDEIELAVEELTIIKDEIVMMEEGD